LAQGICKLLQLIPSRATQESLRSVGTAMGTTACICALPPEVQPAEEVTYPKLDLQAKPTLLRGDRARPSSESTEDDLDRMSSTLASEASPRSQDRGSAEPSCECDQEGASRSNPAAFGLPTIVAGTEQPPTSIARKLEKAHIPRAMTAARPDFSGDWVLLRLEGDIEAMLKELETSWVHRKAAAGMGFGVGMQFVHVEQYANEIRIDTRYMSGKVQLARPKPTFNVYSTDGTEQCITDLEGCNVRTRVTWDGDALSMDSERVCRGSGRPLPSTRRYLQCDGEDLVFEQMSLTTDVVVKRIFRRCKSPVSEVCEVCRSL